MQIVIDIPDYDYRQIKEYYEKNDTVEATYGYIYHGTPLPNVLDNIKAEIGALVKVYPFYNHIDMYVKEDDVRKIIDKYKAENGDT